MFAKPLGQKENQKSRYTTVHQEFLSLLDRHVEVHCYILLHVSTTPRNWAAQCQAFLQFQGATEADFLVALASVQAQLEHAHHEMP